MSRSAVALKASPSASIWPCLYAESDHLEAVIGRDDGRGDEAVAGRVEVVLVQLALNGSAG